MAYVAGTIGSSVAIPAAGITGALGSGVTIPAAGITGALLYESYAIICDQKPYQTHGGTFTSGAWRTRDMNTELYDLDGIVYLDFTDATCDYNNDPTIAHNANTKMVVGMSVTGTGIPVGATIASVTSTTAFELSASTTGGAVTGGTLTFASNQFTLGAGTYTVQYSSPTYGNTNNSVSKLQNMTDAAVIANSYSSVHYSNGGSGNQMMCVVVFTLDDDHAIELQSSCQTTLTTNGFGHGSWYNGSEVVGIFSVVQILKHL